jgi:hypothetical protein
MKSLFITLFAIISSISLLAQTSRSKRLFDGYSFKGWEGDTLQTWRVENGALVGGSLIKQVPHNEFLATTRSYGNFDLKLKFKLVGTGFVNAGVQFRSKRLNDPPYEMSGYQADLGDGYWASLYDESRRNATLVKPDSVTVLKILKSNDWNDYHIRCEGRRIRIWLNEVNTVDFTEKDEKIEQNGLIALQIHGGGKAEASYKDIVITELR